MSHGTRSGVDVVTCPHCAHANRIAASGAGVPRCGGCRHPLPWLTSAGDQDFPAIVTRADLPVLVDLWVPRCGPCRVVASGVERAAEGLAGRLKAVKVNVEEAPRVARRLDAPSIPTLLVLDRGREKGRQVGAVAPDAVLRWAEAAIRA